MMDEREIELLGHKKLSHIPDISNRDIYCFKEGYATAEQRIEDVIKELEEHKSKINIDISKTSEEKYIGYSANEYRRTRIEEIDKTLALLRGKEE